ncbi:MAG: ABC transporter ATP-binding protein [Phycisphaerales bacterium]|nr:ABC transporter ATP-binding protein [Phycisphaerales bacterium]
MPTETESSIFEQRLQAIANHYQQGDVSLGYRRLMDAAIDTQNTIVYNEMTAYTDWLEHSKKTNAELWAKALPLLEKIKQVGVSITKPRSSDILMAQGIKKSYSNGFFSLGPVDLSLKRGELVGLVGENGNGKTTLLRIMAQELKYDTGTIAYHLPQNKNEYDLRSQLAYIPQRTPKWYGSLKDNLKFTLSSYGIKGAANESQVLMIIARMGLWGYRNLNWNQLSSGYKMRFELARTLLRCPDILLLDEPLANLDVMAQQIILEDLKSIANSLSAPMGLILSSQQLYEVEKVSDKVLFLKKGQAMWQENTTIASTILNKQEPIQELIIEFDTDAERMLLQDALSHLTLQKLSFNGGSYIAHFDTSTTMPQVLSALGMGGINVIYIRNISQSTRRFFVAS